MSTKTTDALAAAGAFLRALCAGRVPPCFTPKSEPIALGVNAALPILKLVGFTPNKKLVELRELLEAASADPGPVAGAPEDAIDDLLNTAFAVVLDAEGEEGDERHTVRAALLDRLRKCTGAILRTEIARSGAKEGMAS